MSEFISFTSKNSVKINLEGNIETFTLNTSSWSSEQYIEQWKHAIQHTLKSKETVGLIKGYECSKNHVKMLYVYTVIPEENVFPDKVDCEDIFYITERFMFVSENLSALNSKSCFDEIYDSFGNYFPIYFFNPDHLEHFYLYLSDKIEGISSWRITRNTLCSILELSYPQCGH